MMSTSGALRWWWPAFVLVASFLIAFSSLEVRATEGAEEQEELSSPTGGPAEALRKGRYEEAVDGFRDWIRTDPTVVAAYRGWAEALAAQGRYPEALEVLESSPRYGESPVLQCAAGRIHLIRGRLQEAESTFRAALTLDPDSPEALNRLGEALAKQGEGPEARKAWRSLVTVYEVMSYEDAEKLSPEAFVEMGLALVGLNRYQEAQDVMFAQAKEKDATHPVVLLESARILMEKYNYPDSRFELRDALDENPRFADALVLLADNLLTDFQKGSRRYPLVEKYVERALEVNPNHAEAHVVRGSLWLSDGNVPKAAEDLEKAVALDPSSLRARGLQAACYFLEGKEEALRAAEESALAIHPRGARFFHTLARAVESKFRYKAAVRFCDRALELDPDYWPAYATLAIGCLRTGEEARGREMLENAWQHDRFNVWVYNTRLLLKHMDEEYRKLETENFVFKFPKKDYDVLVTYLVPVLQKAYETLPEHYGTELVPPVYVEAFSEHKWFSARTIGLEGLAAAGASFGNLVTLATPRALPQNWGAVSWHEFAHVVTLHMTRHRVPRWLTEGCSVFEEGRDHPAWARNFQRQIADAFGSGRLLSIAELDFGFSKPKYPNQVLISYFQGCLIVQYIRDKWGFDKVLRLLQGYGENKSPEVIFKEVLGLSLEEFDKEFFAHVKEWVEANGYQPSIVAERIPALQAAVDSDPDNVDRLVELAWAYHSNRIEVDVPITVDRILKLDADNGDAHAILGLEFLARKKKEKAKEPLEKALAGGTRFRFRVRSALGSLEAEAGNTERAVEHLEKAKEISPRAGAAFPPVGNVYYRLADLYKKLGDETAAVRQMEELSRHAPQDLRSRGRVASYYLEKEDEDSARKALRALEEMLYINPYPRKTHESLAEVATRLSEHDVTIREYGYLLKLPETNHKVAYRELARAHAARGNAPEARDYAKKLLELEPESAEAKAILEKLPAESGGS